MEVFDMDFDILDRANDDIDLATLLNFDDTFDNELVESTGNVSDTRDKHIETSDHMIHTVIKFTTVSKSKRKKPGNKPEEKDPLHVAMFGQLPPRNNYVPSNHVEVPILYSFPSYDKSDSLIYFPSTFTRLINSNDFDELSKLFKTKMNRNCDMQVGFSDVKPNTKNLSEIYAFTVDMFPDTVMCVDSVTVEENQIRAVIYRKYTDVKAIKDGLVRTVKTPIQTQMLKTFLRRERFLSYGLTRKATKELKTTLKQETDLEVFLRIQMNLTLDIHCKKVVKLEVIPGVSSVSPLGYCH